MENIETKSARLSGNGFVLLAAMLWGTTGTPKLCTSGNKSFSYWNYVILGSIFLLILTYFKGS